MKCDGKIIISRLKEVYEINQEDFASLKVYNTTKDPFKLLIATILSQNTTDKSAIKAYYNLELNIGVTPKNLAEADIEKIRNLIKIVGLSNNKARNIKELSNIILNKYNDLNKILSLDPNEARRKLTELPGVGEKTADVVLLTTKGYEFFPVDTHIRRISIRLGLASDKDSYSEISRKLKEFFKENLLEAHLLLIVHGRKTCKSKSPLCNTCVIRDCCKFGSSRTSQTFTS
ncbi:MAG: endonuclease III [Sulfolobaceae archaeon]